MTLPEAAAAALPAHDHDHARCVDGAIGAALALCEARGRRLTALRRRVLEIVWRSHAPIGAYAVLDLLAAERGRVTPPTVYRALEFLAREGLVHRLDTLNAFVGCSRPAHGHAARFLICGACGVVHEFEDAAVDRALAVAAALAGFAVDRQTVEIRGRCGPCRAAVPAS